MAILFLVSDIGMAGAAAAVASLGAGVGAGAAAAPTVAGEASRKTLDWSQNSDEYYPAFQAANTKFFDELLPVIRCAPWL